MPINYLIDGYTYIISGEGDVKEIENPHSICVSTLKFEEGITSVNFKADWLFRISEVILPRSCKKIVNAFYLPQLEELTASTLTENVLRIKASTYHWYEKAKYSFSGDTLKITSKDCIILPKLQTVATESIKHVIIEGEFTSIQPRAFSGFHNLETIEINAPIHTLWEEAFYALVNLRSVKLPPSLRIIQKDAFNSCYRLTNLVLPENLQSIGRSAFESCYSLKSVVIPDSVTAIGDYAFVQCSALKSIKFSNGCKYIPIGACSGCFALTDVEIPEKVERIRRDAFNSCTALTNIPYSLNVKYYERGCFMCCYGMENITIPNGITLFHGHWLTSCKNIKSITIPSSVRTIDPDALDYLPNLERVVAPKHLSRYHAFRGKSFKVEFVDESSAVQAMMNKLPSHPITDYVIKHRLFDRDFLLHVLKSVEEELPEVRGVIDALQ